MLHFLSIVIAIFGLSSAPTNGPIHCVLTDVEKKVNLKSFEIQSRDLTPDCPYLWSVRKYVLHEEIEVIRIDNGRLRFDLVPGRGLSIMQISLDDFYPSHNFNGPQGQIQSKEAADWLVRSGSKLSVSPASFVEVLVEKEKPYRITLRGKIKAVDMQKQNLELTTEISTVPGSNTLQICDTFTNPGSVERELNVLYQTNYSSPFINNGSRFISAARQVTPANKQSASNISSYDTYNLSSDTDKQAFSLQFWADQNKHTKIMLQNNNAENAVSMDFSINQLPLSALLKRQKSKENDYIMSLKAGTNPPDNSGNPQKLAPNQSRSFNIEFSLYTDANQVDSTAKNITAIKDNRQTTIAATPRSSSNLKLEDIIKAAKTWQPTFKEWYGKPAPDFALLDISDKEHRISNYHGKNILIVFWATWCPPCKREIPDLIELRKTTDSDDLVMLAISNENPNVVKRFVAQAKINYDVLLDKGALPMPYKSVQAIPCSFFIDAEGKIKLAAMGMVSLKEIKMIFQTSQ